MHSDIRAVIFDMDGLLLDSEILFKKSWQEASKTLGYTLTDDLFLELIGRTAEDSNKILVDKFGADFPHDKFRELGAKISSEMLNSGPIPLKPGALELLEFLKGKNIPLAVASSTQTDEARRRLAAAKLLPYFKAVIGGDMVAYGKPSPEIYVRAACELIIPPAYCLAIEDSHAGVKSARAADLITYMVPDLMPVTLEMEDTADGIFDSLNDVLAELKK